MYNFYSVSQESSGSPYAVIAKILIVLDDSYSQVIILSSYVVLREWRAGHSLNLVYVSPV